MDDDDDYDTHKIRQSIIHIFVFFFFYRLAVIYTGAMADIKRTILRTLETPVS
jgi:hypothetical protein